MLLVEKHIIKQNHKFYFECDQLSFLSKNLYNYANYIIRQKFINDNEYLNYYDINKLFILEHQLDYYELPAKVSNGILRLLDKNWRSFFESIKEYSKNKSKYNGRPKLPKYKNIKNGRNIVIYEKGSISKRILNNDQKLKLSKTNIEISTNLTYDQIQSARIVPRYGHYVIEIIYNKEVNNHDLNMHNVMGIDLGVNNLLSVATTNGNSFIINGKPLKSINQYFNKQKAKLQSDLEPNQFSSNRLIKLSNKRNNKIDYYLHTTSKFIINYCLSNNIGKIVIGNNKNWKQSIDIGKRNNQNFVNIPFKKLINMIEYKAKLESIELVITEENYTSKCSFVDDEKMCKHTKYSGKRIKRGLFRTANGLEINADINAAFNMIRKVIPLFNVSKLRYGIEDVAVHPLRFSIA